MIGQQGIREQIKKSAEDGTLARFVILAGERGSGRKTLAKEIAKSLNAECVVVEKGVDAVRDVIEQSYKLSSEVVYILDGDSMSGVAKSALLKVTEEPPNKARFILTVINLELTLDTLISRACVYRMERYSDKEIAEFAGSDDWRYPSFCTNKYEVDMLQKYGIDEFTGFVKKVVDNISTVSSANALKIGRSLALSNEEDRYDFKVFLQAFRTECMFRVQEFEEYPQKMVYLDWIEITTEIIEPLTIPSADKQKIFDKWLFSIRAVHYAES